jgi:hypothetical protein
MSLTQKGMLSQDDKNIKDKNMAHHQTMGRYLLHITILTICRSEKVYVLLSLANLSLINKIFTMRTYSKYHV